MSKPTLGLAMIVRDAEAGLEACLNSVKDYVDEIVIVLAGKSKDKTEDVARRFTDEVYDFEWCDDFAAARNFAFSKLTTDWALWLDHDDELIGGENLARLIEVAERQNFGCYHLPYHYRRDSRDNCTVMHTRERLLRLSLGWTWTCRVHEFAKSAQQHLVGFSNEVHVKHLTNKANTERNLRLLRLMEAEMEPDHPDYPRLLGALQDIHQSTQQWEEAIRYGEAFFEAVGITVHKWTGATELARSYQALKDWPMVVHWSHVALSIHPEYALPYLLLAHAAYFGDRNPEKALLYLKDANSRLEAPLTSFRQPLDYTANRWDVEHRVLDELGRPEEARALVERAMNEVVGDSPKWRYFQWLYLEHENVMKSVQATVQLVDHLFRRGDTLNARELMRHLPVTVRHDRRLVALYDRVEALTAHVFDDKKYEQFYAAAHSSTDDPDHVMNAMVPEPHRLDPLIERLRKRGAKRVLDIGCGAGEPAIYLAKAGFEVVGIDINKAAVAEARWRAKKITKRNGVKPWQLDFRCGTIETIGPENIGRFDAVVMMELIEHLHPSKVPFYLGSAEDFLNPGGAVYLSTPGMLVGDIPGVYAEFPRDHVKEFTRQDLESLLVQPTKRVRLPLSLFKLYDEKVPIPGFAAWFMEYEMYPERPAWPEWEQPIAIYVGPGLEDWDPTTPDEKGLGGSETWAVKIARELRAKGHPVVVYANADGVWDGVIYRSAAHFVPSKPFAGEKAWLCIVSRHLELLEERPNAEHVAFVAHDTDYSNALTETRLANMDAYAVMSEWQRSHTQEVYCESGWFDPYKICVIQNGIEPSFFEGVFLCNECLNKARSRSPALANIRNSAVAHTHSACDFPISESVVTELQNLGIALYPIGGSAIVGFNPPKDRRETSRMFGTKGAEGLVEVKDGLKVVNGHTPEVEKRQPILTDATTLIEGNGVADSSARENVADVLDNVLAGHADANVLSGTASVARRGEAKSDASFSIENSADVTALLCAHFRQRHSFIWSSSPDRGLDRLLEWWPEIRKLFPDAILSIFYGWENIDALSPQRPWLAPFKARIQELCRQPGVKWVGRLGQRELAREWMRTQFWLYPSVTPWGEPWHETFCITAIEAAAGGCLGIFPDSGALGERPGLRFPAEQIPTEDVLGILRQHENSGQAGFLEREGEAWSWMAAAERLLEAVGVRKPERELEEAHA